MSQRIARDRQRANPNSPTPSPAPGIKKSFSLDAIMKASDNPYSPNQCYGLDVRYRNNPRYNPRAHFQPIPKGAARASLSPRSPRRVWGSPVNGLPLSKSVSLPEFYLETDPNKHQPPTPVGPWSCKACLTTNQNHLEPGPDSTWSCSNCGAEAEGPALMDLERPGNCPKEKDSQQVSDGAPRHTAEQAGALALANGPQSAAERKSMHQAHAGGTRMSTKALKKHGFINGQNRVDKAVVEGAKEGLEARARDELCNRKIIDEVEKLFDVMERTMDGRVEKHIRLTLIRIYTNALMHKSVCKQKGCMLCLSVNPNAKLIAYSVTEQCLQDLITASESTDDPPDHVDTIGRLTGGEVTLQQLHGYHTEVKQLNSKYGSPVHRMSASSAVAIISSWNGTDALKPCPESAPAALLHPTTHNQGEYGKSTQADPGDVMVKMRAHLSETAKITHSRGDVRNMALSYLTEPKTIEFITGSDLGAQMRGWSVGVMACLLLECAAKKLQRNEPNPVLVRLTDSLLKQEDISPTTFADQVGGLVNIMNLNKPPSTGDIFPCG